MELGRDALDGPLAQLCDLTQQLDTYQENKAHYRAGEMMRTHKRPTTQKLTLGLAVVAQSARDEMRRAQRRLGRCEAELETRRPDYERTTPLH